MKKLALGEFGTWQQIEANVAAQGYVLRLDRGADPALYAQFCVERDEDHGALEVYGWDANLQSGTRVAVVDTNNVFLK